MASSSASATADTPLSLEPTPLTEKQLKTDRWIHNMLQKLEQQQAQEEEAENYQVEADVQLAEAVKQINAEEACQQQMPANAAAVASHDASQSFGVRVTGNTEDVATSILLQQSRGINAAAATAQSR